MIGLNVMSHAKIKDHKVVKHFTINVATSRHGGNLLTMAMVLGVHHNNVFDAMQRCHVLVMVVVQMQYGFL
jgi:hypothetical protein